MVGAKYDTTKGGYVVHLDKRQLEGAPAYDVDTDPAWGDRAYETKIYDYYGVGLIGCFDPSGVVAFSELHFGEALFLTYGRKVVGHEEAADRIFLAIRGRLPA